MDLKYSIAIDFGRMCRSIVCPLVGSADGDRVQVIVERLISTGSNKANKRSKVAVIGHLECLVVAQAVFDEDDHGWKAGFHEDQVHQQPRRPPVAVNERMNVNEFVVGERRQLDRMNVESFLGIQPLNEFVHFVLYILWLYRREAADINLSIAENARLHRVDEA